MTQNNKPRPEYREGKTKDMAHGMAEYVQQLVKECREAFPTCLSCVHFDEARSFCARFQGNPPPRIIVYACPEYIDREAVPY